MGIVKNEASYVEGWKSGFTFAQGLSKKAFEEGYLKGMEDAKSKIMGLLEGNKDITNEQI